MNKINIVVAITGASGSLYAKLLLDKLANEVHNQVNKVAVIMSKNAADVWQYELQNDDYKKYPFHFYEANDFMAPFASGSSDYTVMIVCPCSMGTMARINSGISNDLLTRAADVVLKERRKLIIVPRETPFNGIHLKNMEQLHQHGAIICPAVPSFYSRPKSVEALVDTVVYRILKLAGFEIKAYQWGEEKD